ncbi:flagellin N-terminal helical domain-containing protein [Marinobacter oulmenensis]|uniref:Flagellin n=1 Tax=Marinobacter oulmenensis TaxID=643747 RepID=A0A840UC07_9GAMM|nr:flagellin [Marinobacter oulmenensis]MBB5322562.1 flagellin [Marinobacter oulmenensis]
MPQIINTNIASLNAQRNLNASQGDANVALQRLSSGLRINSAKDDAAGLAISERFQSQITGLQMAQRNANDGISLSQTAEGALDEVANNLQRIRELAVQSANATNSNSDRDALNQEVQQRLEEINRIASQTSFNGLKVLDGTFRTQTFQVGANTGETIGVSGLDTRGSQIGAVIDQTQLFSELALGPASATSNFAATAFDGGVSGEIEVSIGSGASPEGVGRIYIDNAQSRDDFISQFREQVRNNPDINGLTIEPVSGSATGFTIGNSLDDGYTLNSSTFNTAFNNMAVSGASNSTTIEEYFEEGNTITFDVDITNPDTGESVGIEVRDATSINDIVAQVNAESNRTGVSANLDSSNTNIIFSSQFDTSFNVAITGDAGGNPIDITVEGDKDTDTLSADFLDVSTKEGADRAMIAVDYAIDAINGFRAELGAVQNRFESTIQNLSTTSENLSASNSRIRDADFAAETAELARTQVLQQAGLSVLSQANARPQQVLQLLQG